MLWINVNPLYMNRMTCMRHLYVWVYTYSFSRWMQCTCMQKRRTTQGLQRKTECESRSLIAMQMTRVYRLDSEVKLIKSACTHTIASSSCAGSSIVLNGKRPCRVQLFVCDTSFFPVIPVVAENAGFVQTLCVPAGSCQLRYCLLLSVFPAAPVGIPN